MSNFEDELDRIRVELYEELKGLTNAESAKIVGERAKKIAEQYKIRIVTESPRKRSSCNLHRA